MVQAMTRTLSLAAALLGLAAAPAPALAGNVDDIRVALPEIVELAEIQPGLQVVTRLDIEVFALDGAYWLQSDGRWYASRRPLEGFQAVEPRGVPPALARLKKGAYLDYRPTHGELITQRRVASELPAPADAGAKAAPRPAAPTAVPLPPPPAVPARAEAKPAAPAPKAQPKPPPPAKKAPAKPAPQKKPAAK